MFVNLRVVALALFVAVAVVRAEDTPANGTTPDATAGNGTTADAPATPGNGTSADAPGTSNNGTTAEEPPAAPQPSNGPTGSNSRRALQACEWSCPWRGANGRELLEFDMEGAFKCTYADAVTCVYQKTTGVLTLSLGDCPNAATALTAGCVPGQSTNGGLLRHVRRARQSRRTSRDIQREALVRRHML